ncbi:MAG: outer membrane beta-barrel protein [Verrucomicrobiales bacterium]|nr:outer membrane beta-barrel protein [Verrucomicrobiales bacterium]
MKKKASWRIVLAGQTKRTRRLIWVTMLGLSALAGAARAQQVFAPPPPSVSVTPPAIEALGPGEMQVFPPDSAVANFLDELHPLQWGPVALHPHASYQFTYGTGIRSGTNQPPSDMIVQTFAPGVLFVMGTHWTLDYTPTFTFYSDNSFDDTVGHSVTLTGGTIYEDWTLGLSQNFTYSSLPQAQTGTQTEQQTYSTALTASRPLSSKISVDFGVNQNLNFPTGFQSSKEWSTMDWLNYQFWPRLVIGVGAGAGYIATTPNTLFEQLQGRANWRATDKVSFGINGGAEFSQFTDGGEAPLINPIFGGSIQYQPFEQTKLSLNASREVNTSYYQNQITEVTSLNGGVRQRLFQKFYLNVSGGYTWTTYVSAVSGASANSSSDYYSINVQLSTSILKRGSVAVFYNYSQNTTDQPGLAYSSNQVGFNLGYSF